jgi:phage shock protein PspC (stress-responsive transcriptional regulator)
MLITAANPALIQTLALLATFLGIGVVVNAVIIYIVGQVMAEHRQNRERREGGS